MTESAPSTSTPAVRRTRWAQFLRGSQAATTLEYSVLLALLAATVLAAIVFLGVSPFNLLSGTVSSVTDTVQSAGLSR